MGCGTFTLSIFGFWTFEPILSRRTKHTVCNQLIESDPEEKEKADGYFAMSYFNYVQKQAYRDRKSVV